MREVGTVGTFPEVISAFICIESKYRPQDFTFKEEILLMCVTETLLLPMGVLCKC